MDVWRQKTSIVSKLRVKGKRLDGVALRLHFERLFGADNFLPEGLPPKAIVCIKNLRDPSPRTLRLNHSDLIRSDAWRSAVAREIKKLYGRAFQPIREIVPAQAESVVFADNSEMLACLASDWCKELLTQNWWWRSLFPNLQHAQTIARIWIESAEFVPSALQILAKRGKAVEFVTKLHPNEASDLLRQITTIFGLDNLQKVLFESFAKNETIAATAKDVPIAKKSSPTEDFFFAEFQTRAPWSEFVPEAQHSLLSFEQQSLLGIGLMLARAPRVARSTEFARQVKIFRAEFEISRTAAQNKVLKITKKPKKRQAKIETFSSLRKKLKSPAILPESKLKTGKASKKTSIKFFADSPDAVKKTAERPDSSGSLKSEIFPPTGKSKEKSKQIIFEDSLPEKNVRQESEAKSYQSEKQLISTDALPEKGEEIKLFAEAEADFEFVVDARFGGVFYLLNLALYLNLYRDFTESGEVEIDLNVWDFVALLSLEFLGEKIKDDAVWNLLARLAGRENEDESGQNFSAPDEWRMPPAWLKTFQTNKKWLWASDGERLVVRHPAGFSVINVSLLGDVKTQLEKELEIYRKDFSEIRKSNLKNFPEHFSMAGNWLKNLTEYVRRRLFQALNVKTQKQINRILFERRARVSVTATHLDITFSLADLPFEVRLSGLDRNPGWIPAVGKFVNFHFV